MLRLFFAPFDSLALAQGRPLFMSRSFLYLLFPFLVFRLFFAPLAKLLELNFTLNFFAVLARPIVHPFAGPAGEFNEIVL